jgi:hypothetical protein
MRTTSFLCSAALLVMVFSMPSIGQQNSGHLRTKVNPGRAGVFIDGKYVGPAANFGVGRTYAVPLGSMK